MQSVLRTDGLRLTENGSDLHHGPDQERRDEGEDDAGDQLEEEAVEQDVEAVQLNIGHLQHTKYNFIMSFLFLKRKL